MAELRRTDLNNIRYLLEVADTGSFSAAARLFGVPPSLVSRRIAQLEKDVGARLFQRTTRSLSLTDAGRSFLTHARTGMHSLFLAHESVGTSQQNLHGRIRISVPVGAASIMWASISKFLTAHPGVRIEMEVEDRYVNLIEERFDMVIRAGAESRVHNLVGRRLLAAQRWLFASADYLRRRGMPQTVGDLTHHDCVILGTRAERVTWRIHVGKRIRNVVVQGRIAVNESKLATECVLAGFGIGFLPLAICAEHLQTGKLKRVLTNASAGNLALWLVYPNRHLPAASRALVQFLIKELPLSLPQTSGSEDNADQRSGL